MLPIIDTHQHLWDLGKLRLPWLAGGGRLATNHLMSDYLKAVEGLNVVKTVYMEVDVDPADHVKEAEYVLDLCRRDDNPMAAAVIGGRPASEGFEAYIRRFEGNRYIKGVRQVLGGTPEGYCAQPEFIRGVRALGELSMSFDICIPPAWLPDAIRLVDACPRTRFILDHCGNANVQAPDPTAWRRDITEMAKRDRVVCKISGIVSTAKPGAWRAEDLAPTVEHCAEAFGRDRIMFASDWPVCTTVASLREWVEALRQIVAPWPEADRRKLFHDNAARVYGLSA